MPDNNSMIPGLDEALKEIEEYMASRAKDPAADEEPVETITIKFGKGLVGEPFMSKNGNEFVEIRIPNSDPEDKRPWQTFVLPARDVHENRFGKGMWAKIPADGHTTVWRSVLTGEADGKKQWDTEKKPVTNAELKSMIEFYKEKPRESVIDQLHKDRVSSPAPPAGKQQDYEELPFC